MVRKNSEIKILETYVDGVLSGLQVSCSMVFKAVERWSADLADERIVFDEDAYVRFVRFCSYLRHYKGAMAGKPFILEPWQCFIAANIFGLKWRATGFRKYRYADVFVPRKNGKTTFAAAIALYLLVMDGEPAAEVFAAAVDKEQAKICFDTAKGLLQGSPLADEVDVYRGSIVFPQTTSSFKPMSKDTKNKDGLNPHAAICDERHAWKTNEIYEVIKTGIGARRQPLVFSISTAGTDTSYPYFSDIAFFEDVMKGVQQKDDHFIMLYEPDEGDDWADPVTWQKVNPNYGVSLYEDYMRGEYNEARLKGGSTLAAFQTKNLNIWVDAPEVWVSDDDVAENNGDIEDSQLVGQECYVGIDLASKSDITAVAFWFPRFRAVRFLFAVPEAKVQERGDRVDYRRWAEEGWLTVTSGNVLDEDWFMHELLTRMDQYKVQRICYDPWGMWNLKGSFGKYSTKLMEWGQSIRNMSVPTKWLEGEVLLHNLNFMGNPIIRWMFRNVTIYRDPNANIKLDKARSRDKIDGVVALVDALGGWLAVTGGKPQQRINYNSKYIRQ